MAQPSNANLSLDFTTGVMPSGFTATRTSSSATIFNSRGLVQTVAANTPRLNYNPANLSAGSSLLVEGSATNLCLQSQNIVVGGGTWGGTNTTCVLTSEVTSPAGDNTSSKATCLASSYNSVTQQFAVTAGVTYTFSYWIRSSVAGNTHRVFNLTTPGNIVDNTPMSYTGTGWTRVQTTFTVPVGCTDILVYCLNQNAGASAEVFYIWGAQLEVGIGSSSYIPTTTASVLRDADLVSLAWNEASRLWSTTQGTMFVEARMNRFKTVDAPSFFPKLVAFTASGASRFGLAYNPDTLSEALISELSISGGVSTIYSPPIGGYAYSSNVNFRVAFSALGTVTLRSAFNGTAQTAATDTVAPNFGSVNGLQFNPGQDATCPTANIRTVRYWNRSFSQAELNALTL